MSRIAKMTTMAVVIALVLSVFPLLAQEPAPVSNTSKATAGIYGNDVDDYMNYFNYSDVQFDKHFGFAGWNGHANIGYAHRFGGLHLGLLYNGLGFWQYDAERVETITPTYFNNNDGELNNVKTELEFSNQAFSTNNGIYALFGIAGMGIGVGIRVETETYSEPNDVAFITTETGTRIVYEDKIDSYNQRHNSITPFIGWGMKLNLGSMVLKPFVEASMALNSNEYELITTDYTTNNEVISGVQNFYSFGAVGWLPEKPNGNLEYVRPNIRPDIKAGFGLGSGNLEFGLNYGLGIDVYSDNSYDIFGISGDVKGITYWDGSRKVTSGGSYTLIEDEADVFLAEISGMTHRINPSLYYSWQLTDRAKLGLLWELPFQISKSSADISTIETTITDFRAPTDKAQNFVQTTTTKEYYGLVEESTFSVWSSISLGSQFIAIPDRFTLNAGLIFTPISFSKTAVERSRNGYQVTQTTTVNEFGNVTEDTLTTDLNSGKVADKLTETKTWDQMSASIRGGFTLNFTPKFALDTVFQAGYGGYGLDLDITEFNILFTIKK